MQGTSTLRKHIITIELNTNANLESKDIVTALLQKLPRVKVYKYNERVIGE